MQLLFFHLQLDLLTRLIFLGNSPEGAIFLEYGGLIKRNFQKTSSLIKDLEATLDMKRI